MQLANFTLDQLKVLPLRAIVAFAARCARRVEPLAQLPEGDAGTEGRRTAVDAALRMAEAFARGEDSPPDESVVAAVDALRDGGDDSAGSLAVSAATQAAHAVICARSAGSQALEGRGSGRGPTQAEQAAGSLTRATADLAAMNAYTAAAGAFVSVGYHNENFVNASLRDYHTLAQLQLGRYPELGAPIDPSPEGPLGPL